MDHNSADITLVFPSSPFLLTQNMFPPLGIMALSAFLKLHGIWVQCLDLSLPSHTKEMAEADIIGLSFSTPQREEAFKLTEYYKAQGKYVVAGGPHPSHMPEECYSHGIDKVIEGPGEIPLLHLMADQLDRPYLKDVKKYFINELPFPDRSSLPMDQYQQFIDGRKATAMIASRSCPFHCLRGDTIIHTIEGDIPIKDLTGKQIKVLTRDPITHDPVYADAYNIGIYGKDQKMVRVHFDDHSYIDCTPDHKFMAFQGGNKYTETTEWECEAKDLKAKQRVKAVRFEFDKQGRKSVSTQHNIIKFNAQLIMERILGRKLYKNERVHHKDRNPGNDSFSNLQLTTKKKHVTDCHPEISERMKINNPAFGLPHEHFVELGKKQKGKTRSLESRLRYRESKLGEKNPRFKKDVKYRYHKTRIEGIDPYVNHKIAWVEESNEQEDVYCMQVPGYDWFYANKVLVHNCSFCANIKQKFEIQNAVKTMMEIDHLHAHYGYTAFSIYDDTFAIDKKRLQILADMLEPLDYKFRCFCRANLMTEDVCNNFKRMGVTSVGIGVESGSDEILKLNLKGTSTAENTMAIENLRKVGIESKAFLIVGLPGETEETVAATARWIEEARPDDIAASVFQPLPGSAIFKNPEKWGVSFIYDSQPMWYRGKPGEYKPTIATKELSTERIAELRDWLENKYKDPSLLK